MFSWFKKKTIPTEEIADLADWNKTCPDCETARGNIHDLFCTKERCPFCSGQLASCDCIHEVLKLDADERRAVEEYVDDSVEPLQGIMKRWRAMLEQKGRVPFEPQILGVNADSLILTAACGALPFIRTLLAKGVPMDAANEVGCTALLASARSYRLEVLVFLLQAGANVRHRDSYGHTALHCAVGSPAVGKGAEMQVECVRLLLKHGAEIDAQNQSGGTPLMSATWFGCGLSVECLLRAGANVSLKDSKGRTALQLGRERGHNDIVARIGH